MGVLLLNFCPASRGLRHVRFDSVAVDVQLNFCPASRGLRPVEEFFYFVPRKVELLPRFKGIATSQPGAEALQLPG